MFFRYDSQRPLFGGQGGGDTKNSGDSLFTRNKLIPLVGKGFDALAFCGSMSVLTKKRLVQKYVWPKIDLIRDFFHCLFEIVYF